MVCSGDPACWEHLPDGVLSHVLALLPLRVAVIARTVCRCWRQCFDDHLEALTCCEALGEAMVLRFPAIKHLRFARVGGAPSKQHVISCLRLLKKRSLEHLHLDPGLLDPPRGTAPTSYQRTSPARHQLQLPYIHPALSDLMSLNISRTLHLGSPVCGQGDPFDSDSDDEACSTWQLSLPTALTTLTSLTVADRPLDLTSALQQLQKLPSLHSASLELAGSSTAAAPDIPAALAPLRHLTSLSLRCSTMSAHALDLAAVLTSAPQLASLHLTAWTLLGSTPPPAAATSSTPGSSSASAQHHHHQQQQQQQPQLQSLRLDSCSTSGISPPAGLHLLRSLTQLHISHSPFISSAAATTTLTTLTALQQLSLHHCDLEALPRGITALVQLQQLHISEHEITGLALLGHLLPPSLRQVELAGSCGSLGALVLRPVMRLTGLQVLRLSGEGLLPGPAISSLTNLRHLALNSCGLATPDLAHLQALTALTLLQLRSNLITALPEHLPAAWQHLRSLDLDDNPQPALPKQLSRLTALRELSACRSIRAGSESLPAALANLAGLSRLSLKGRLVRQLPGSFSCLQRLQALDLRLCQLEVVPEVVPELKQLTELRLDGNLLRALPRALGGLRMLHTLSASGQRVAGGGAAGGASSRSRASSRGGEARAGSGGQGAAGGAESAEGQLRRLLPYLREASLDVRLVLE